MAARAKCPHCLQEVSLRKDGKLSAHRRRGLVWGRMSTVRVRCEGGGKKPPVYA